MSRLATLQPFETQITHKLTLYLLLQAYQGTELLAMKVYDACNPEAIKSCITELSAYHALHALQGQAIPKLHSFGRMGHTGCPAIATYWAGHCIQSEVGLMGHLLASAEEGLQAIHSMQVSHGDVRPSNRLLNKDRVVFCDFGQSKTDATFGDCQEDLAMLDELPGSSDHD